MSDQASGLRRWSQDRNAAHREAAAGQAGRAAPVEAADERPMAARGRCAELVVMRLAPGEPSARAVLHALAALPLPEGFERWRPRPLTLEGPLEGALPTSPWWALWLPAEGVDRRAPQLAGALRTLARRAIPTRLLLLGETQSARGLDAAARQHLGLELLLDAEAWLAATRAPQAPEAGGVSG